AEIDTVETSAQAPIITGRRMVSPLFSWRREAALDRALSFCIETEPSSRQSEKERRSALRSYRSPSCPSAPSVPVEMIYIKIVRSTNHTPIKPSSEVVLGL